MKKVLITGSSGFLGKRLIAALEQKDVEVTALSSADADLTDCRSLSAFSGEGYDHIFHLAAWTQAGDFCDKRRGEQWIINQQINTNMLDWWRREAPQARMIACGTSVSYTVEEGLTEDRYMDGNPTDKFHAYAMSKRMLLAGLQSLHRQYGLEYLYVIPSTMYGPGYHLDSRQMHFIYDLIRKILRGKLYGAPVTLWGDGHQRRELVYVDDFIRMLFALNEHGRNDHFNIAAGDDHSIREFAAVICRLTGYDPGQIAYDTAQYVGAKSKVLSTVKFEAAAGKLPRTSLEEGIAQTIRWVETNKDILLPA